MACEGKNNVISVKTETDEFSLKGRPCELSAFSHVPTSHNAPAERTFFNTPQNKPRHYTVYDQIFTVEHGYNEKLPRDDREHAKLYGLDTLSEEAPKKVPSMSSTYYGHYLDNTLEVQDRLHVRVGRVQAEFYRRNGIENL